MITKAVRFTRGEDLRKSIEEYCLKENIASGAVIAAVGSLSRATIRLADGRTVKEFPGHYEICSLSGTICNDGSHMHISLSDTEGSMIGGHVSYGCIINTTLEVVIADMTEEYQFSREYDEATGYKELVVKQRS